MSFIEPNLGQVQKNQKILQELEEKKRRMRSSSIYEKRNSKLKLVLKYI